MLQNNVSQSTVTANAKSLLACQFTRTSHYGMHETTTGMGMDGDNSQMDGKGGDGSQVCGDGTRMEGSYWDGAGMELTVATVTQKKKRLVHCLSLLATVTRTLTQQ